MKAGYLTLFSLAVAYSAYQGAVPSMPSAVPTHTMASTSSENRADAATLRDQPLPPSVDPFPTIAAGMWKYPDDRPTAKCGDSKAVCPTKDLSGLLEDYFRADQVTHSGDPVKDAQELEAHWNVPPTRRDQINFVIASLPDPVRTHMALTFDREIEAIQSSAQASGYLFARAWMPWDIASHSESTDFTVRLSLDKYRDQVESLPGLMIFQKPNDLVGKPPQILFVFVVGETPTGGLRIEQFQNALKIRADILECPPDGNCPRDGEISTLRIFGPTFSGSLLSLVAILKEQTEFSTITIRSGSVSSYLAVHNFCESAENWPNPRAHPDFKTFQFSDEYEEFFLKTFFWKREGPHSHIAVLSEDETAFGNQDLLQKDATNLPRANQAAPASAPCVDAPQPVPKMELTRLYFPREIAQLRDAYQRDVKNQAAPEGNKSPPQTGLSLSLSVTGSDVDSIAPYSPAQTPLSQESILQAIVATLRKLHARTVIIRASDPLDMVFLCRYLRQNYPQGRLVTVGADLLMVHDSYDPRFHGILAVSPYPLLSGAEYPTSGKNMEIHRLFPDSYSVGAFNAFQSLLAADNATETGENYKANQNIKARMLPAAKYEQFGLPSFLQPEAGDEKWRAHLWLAAIGREGYWPVEVLDSLSASVTKPEPTIPAVDAQPELPKPFSVHPSVGGTTFWVVTVALTSLMAFLLGWPPFFPRSEVLGRFTAQPSPARNRLLFFGSLLLLACQTIFVFPAIVWLGRFDRAYSPRLGDRIDEVIEGLSHGLGLVMLCYLFSFTFLAISSQFGFRRRGSVAFANGAFRLWRVGMVLTLVLTLYCTWAELSPSLSSFVYRYINVGSGVAPSLPLLFLLAAWIWWCWQTLTGIVSTEEKQIRLPEPNEFGRRTLPDLLGKTAFEVEDASVRLRLKSLAKGKDGWPWPSLRSFPLNWQVLRPAAVGFGLIAFLMWPPEIAEAFESHSYKIIYWLMLYSCLFLICHLMAQIISLWLDFRRLLRAIESVPFRRGFGDLAKLTWKPLWELAGSGREEFLRLLAGELDTLRRIQTTALPKGQLKKAISSVLFTTQELAEEYGKIRDLISRQNRIRDTNPIHSLFEKLQDEMAELASEGMIYASQQWLKSTRLHGSKRDASEDRDNKDPGESAAKDPILRAIERFLCLFYLNVILVPLRRLQTLILALAGVFVFVLLSYTSYPFESRESFHVLLITIFFAISLGVGIVYGQMYNNPLLKRITAPEQGHWGLDFWVRIGTFVFIPLLSLLSVQFPEVNNFLFSWLQPALQSIK